MSSIMKPAAIHALIESEGAIRRRELTDDGGGVGYVVFVGLHSGRIVAAEFGLDENAARAFYDSLPEVG